MTLRALILALSVPLFWSVTAQAQHSIVALGLRSLEGDDAVALSLSQALRKAGDEVPDWFMGTQSVSLSQMVLVHGCDEVTTHCLTAIAKGLNVDHLIYGELKRDTPDIGHGFEAEIHLFGTQSATIEGRATRSFSAAEADEEGLARVATDLITQLNPQAAEDLPPMLTVESNVEGATVHLNGQHVGQVQSGSLQLRGLEPGMYKVQVGAVGYTTGSAMVELSAGAETLLELPLLPDDVLPTDSQYESDSYGGSSQEAAIPRWLPYGLYGVAVAATAGMVASWVVIDNVANDELYLDYRAAQSGVSDVCVEAKRGSNAGQERFDDAALDDIVSMCDRAGTFEVLQYIFGGVALASAAAGTVLLLMSLDEQQSLQQPQPETAATTPSLRIQPKFSARYGGLAATLSF